MVPSWFRVLLEEAYGPAGFSDQHFLLDAMTSTLGSLPQQVRPGNTRTNTLGGKACQVCAVPTWQMSCISTCEVWIPV
jgi:hypothetical protein